MSIVAKEGDSGFPPTWKWVDDEELVGAHRVMRRARGYDGADAIVWEIEVERAGPVSVWLEPTNLVTKVQGELRRRKKATGTALIGPGEKVRINPGTKRPSKLDSSRTVWPFPIVEFEHGIPEESAEELLLQGFGADEPGDVLSEASEDDAAAPDDDDCPF